VAFRRPTLVVAAITAVCACTSKSPPIAAAAIGGTGVSSAAFRMDSGHATPSIVNTRWLAAEVDVDAKSWSLLKETDSARWCGGETTWCHSLVLAGWTGAVSPPRTADWSVRVAANPGEFSPADQPEFYRAVDPGCCETQDANMYVNLQTGALTFRATGALGRVSIVSSHVSRYVAFLDNWSALKPAESTSVKGVAGVLQYGSAGSSTETVVLTADPADTSLRICCRLDSLEVRMRPDKPHSGQLELTHASWTAPLPPITFWIWMQLLPDYDRPSTQVVIPVIADRIALEQAILPRGLKLQRVSGGG
jgi:hypothetical protein